MVPADLPAVMRIAAVVHPNYPEDEAVFAERLALAPAGCLVLAGAAGELAGYIVSHPWPRGDIPALNALLGAIPASTRDWYLHDLALLPAARGGGRAAGGVSRIVSAAAGQGCDAIALVAVNGSSGFWERQGFRPAHDPALAGKLASYDDAARYMMRGLARD
jgi:GNAT superfamily N-acetyltransferase